MTQYASDNNSNKHIRNIINSNDKNEDNDLELLVYTVGNFLSRGRRKFPNNPCNLLRFHDILQTNITILGCHLYKSFNYLQKIFLMRDEMKQLIKLYPSKEKQHKIIIAFGDINDVLYQCTRNEIIEQFLSFPSNIHNNMVIFNAEEICWNPDEIGSICPNFEKINNYNPNDKDRRYLNSGAYIGRLDNLLKFFDLIDKLIDIKTSSYFEGWGDQSVYIYLWGNMENISYPINPNDLIFVDYNITSFYVTRDNKYPDTYDYQNDLYLTNKGFVINETNKNVIRPDIKLKHGIRPCIFHAPSSDKDTEQLQVSAKRLKDYFSIKFNRTFDRDFRINVDSYLSNKREYYSRLCPYDFDDE